MNDSRRPNWMPADLFRAYLTPKELNRWLLIDGILPSSYLERIKRNHGTIRSVQRAGQRLYRAIDLVAKARAMGQPIEPSRPIADESEKTLLRSQIGELRDRRDELLRRVADASHQVRMLELSVSATGKRLLSEDEIVTAAKPFASTSGVYFLIKDGRVRYVGQSVNLFSRISSHVASKDFTHVSFVEFEPALLDVMETLYIHMLQPPLNRDVNGRLQAPMNPIDLARRAAGCLTNRETRETPIDGRVT